MRRQRFPLDDLTAAMRSKPRDDAHFAALLGVSPNSMSRMRAEGLSEEQADRYTCRLGFPPEAVWADYLDESLAERGERIFAGLRQAEADLRNKEAC